MTDLLDRYPAFVWHLARQHLGYFTEEESMTSLYAPLVDIAEGGRAEPTTEPAPLRGRKDDGNKLRVDLVPIEGIEGAARAFAFGASKYGQFNWAGGIEWLRFYGAVLRHLFAWVRGEGADRESGHCHLDHALASLMMLKASVERKLGKDDRPTYNRP